MESPETNKNEKSSPGSTKEDKKSDDEDKSLETYRQQGTIGDDDDLDESIAERLWGLTEMFPNSVRSTAACITDKTLSFVKASYKLSRQVVWFGISTSVLLFAPVMFEVERFNMEEMVKQDRNRLLLGPGAAIAGPSIGPGLTPSPSR